MRTFLMILMAFVTLGAATPSHSSNLLCGLLGITCETLDRSEVVIRMGVDGVLMPKEFVYRKHDDEKFTGDVTGQEVFKVVDGEIVGKKVGYFRTGALHHEGQYRDGHRTGEWKDYYENGQLMSVYQYNSRGVLHGPTKRYHEDGLLDFEGQYKHGRNHGKWLMYDDRGFVALERIFENGNFVSEKCLDPLSWLNKTC